MLNIVLPRLYQMGDWKALEAEWSVDGSAGYFALPPDYESILSARSFDYPITIHSQNYEFQNTGPGYLGTSAGHVYGFVDMGWHPLMSEIASTGCDEFIFTTTGTFASGDTAKITYTDTEEGHTEVTLPLHTITVASATSPAAISAAADGGTDSTTGEVLTTLTTANNSAMGLVAGLGLTLSQISGTDATYIGTFRIHSIPTTTSVKIVKSYVALSGTLAAVTTPRLMPVSTIESVESLVYTSLPARTLVKDADGIIYAILPAGDGVSSFRRYRVPQVPEDATEEWSIDCLVKRAFFPLTSTSDIVYLDNLSALRYAFQAAVYEDEGDPERGKIYWDKAKKALDDELFDTRGGVQKIPEFNIWGDGVMPLHSRY
jgi:hypothetical protein